MISRLFLIAISIQIKVNVVCPVVKYHSTNIIGNNIQFQPEIFLGVSLLSGVLGISFDILNNHPKKILILSSESINP